jgi:hypothetical protein
MTKYAASVVMAGIVVMMFAFDLAGKMDANGAQGNASQHVPQVENKTQSLQVISITRGAEAYTLKLRNASNKDINGYSLGTSINSTITTDFTAGNKVFVPNEVIEANLPIPVFGDSSHTPTSLPVIVLAVFFTNGLAEGVPSAIAETKERRLGVKIQIRRVRQLLQDLLVSKKVDTPEGIKDLRAKVAVLTEDPEAHLPPRVRSGLVSAKEDALMEIDEAIRTDGSYREKLNEINRKLERRLNKL